MGKEKAAHKLFKKNINLWYDEYLNSGLTAIISNTSGCGTTLKDYGFIFRDDKEMKKKAKKILIKYKWELVWYNFWNK